MAVDSRSSVTHSTRSMVRTCGRFLAARGSRVASEVFGANRFRVKVYITDVSSTASELVRNSV